MTPDMIRLPNGELKTPKHKFDWSPSQCFYQTDLYSTFFGGAINDEIERRLFGTIDDSGSNAVRAFIGADEGGWRRHFTDFFGYIDAQKVRTPKGLDWLKKHYSKLGQNELMVEMQAIQRMHCSTWAEGVREIVSAADSEVKFIVSDHPVTVYNVDLPPDHALCAYPNDPDISMKASQTIFPLDRDHCLILTNTEYANDPASTSPSERRTFARNYKTTYARTDAFIRTRRLSAVEVTEINFIVKARARRYVAAGREEWLYPDVTKNWRELHATLLPPSDELWRFGGEIYARFADGRVHYQDAFGRTEKPREFLAKEVSEKDLKPNDGCGCGSGQKYKKCCKSKPRALRRSWAELAIRERNMIHYRMIVDTLDLERKNWLEVRRDLTDDQISKVYSLFHGLWPLDTDLLSLLPKPDGVARAVYTGIVDPRLAWEFLVGSSLLFEQVLVINPLIHPAVLRDEYNPVKTPKQYRQEFLKGVALIMELMPLIEAGMIELVPDPCNFDHHLRRQMFGMAEQRRPFGPAALKDDRRAKWLVKDDYKTSLLMQPKNLMRADLKRKHPTITEEQLEEMMAHAQELADEAPFAVLQADTFDGGENSGLLQSLKMQPNFEIAMFLAQATGSFIITDSVFRWRELIAAQHREMGLAFPNLAKLGPQIEGVEYPFVTEAQVAVNLRHAGSLSGHRSMVQNVYHFLTEATSRTPREKLEAQIAARFRGIENEVAAVRKDIIGKSADDDMPVISGHMEFIAPRGGLVHNNVSRMLLTSGVARHLDSVPMAFFMRQR